MEKTERATPHRRRKLREEGDTAYSSQITKAALAWVVLACAVMVPAFALDAVFTRTWNVAITAAGSGGMLALQGLGVLVESMLIPCVVLAVAVLVALVASAGAQGVLYLSPKRLSLKADKINPVAGLKRVFSLNALMEAATYLAQFIVLTIVTCIFLKLHSNDVDYVNTPSHGAVPQAVDIVRRYLIVTLSVASVMALLHWLQQKWMFERRAKMSQQEIKDEYKETEGDPEIRGKIKELRDEILQSESPEKAGEATAIITNPTQIAVAIRFDPATMELPELLVKGCGERASAIRAAAERRRVPIVRNVPLARLLWFHGRERCPVPSDSFDALAHVLAHVLEGVAPEDIPVVPAETTPHVLDAHASAALPRPSAEDASRTRA